MSKVMGRWFKIYENEIQLVWWTVALLFVVRSSNMILNNYAETAFLKRYGVEYLPIVNMLNAFATFVVMGALTALMTRFKDAKVLSYLFLFCGISVAGLRFLIRFDIDIIYPILFMLKSQYEVLQALLFWNLANDFFNTRQSKRIFPFLTAGGVIGLIISSFGTPFLARTFSFDNLLLVYLGLCLLGTLVVGGMSRRFPALLVAEGKKKKEKKRSSMLGEFKKVIPLMKESILLKVLIVITLVPNIVIPIMNYQFNYAVNEQFATEGSLVQFFGFFRGALNIVSLIILLFVGRIYGRWGLPVALMFHPFNYVIAFLAFLLRFDAISAIYARMSTTILRTTINTPANAMLMGLFPDAYRPLVRPFLRGTVVRIGLFTGSGLILLSEPLFHPRYLSLAALPLVLFWIVTLFVLKRRYADILLDLVAKNVLDLKAMEESDIQGLFRDKGMRLKLTESFLLAEGKEALWYGQLLKSFSVPQLDSLILQKIETVDEETKVELIKLLSPEAGSMAQPLFHRLYDTQKPGLAQALVCEALRMETGNFKDFFTRTLDTTEDFRITGMALGGLYRLSPDDHRDIVNAWLSSDDASKVSAGIIAAGESKDPGLAKPLLALLEKENNTSWIPDTLIGLKKLDSPDLKRLALDHLSNPSEVVRLAALEILEISDDEDLKRVISLLGDESDAVFESVKEKIASAPYFNGTLLVKALGKPRRKIREGIFELLERLNIKNIDTYRFAQSQSEIGYRILWEIETLGRLPESPGRDLLIRHLDQEKTTRVQNCLKVMSLQDSTGKLKVFVQGVFSPDIRKRANSMEALESLLDPPITKMVFPLLEETDISQKIVDGRKIFSLPAPGADPGALFSHLLGIPNWVTVLLTLNLMREFMPDSLDSNLLDRLEGTNNAHVRMMADIVLDRLDKKNSDKEEMMEAQITIPDKILHLRKIEIFENLSVGELAAVASVTEETAFPAGESIVTEGEPGDTMYMIVEGEVSIIKDKGKETEFELDRLTEGNYFGEMALFEDLARSATAQTKVPSRFLVLHKEEFKEIVKEYPEIALHICRVLSSRLRKLHEKIRI